MSTAGQEGEKEWREGGRKKEVGWREGEKKKGREGTMKDERKKKK